MARTNATDDARMTEERVLLGAHQLDELLDLAKRCSAWTSPPDRAALADIWRAGASAYQRLAQAEAGAADKPGLAPLPKVMAAHVARLTTQAGVRRTFDTVPVSFLMVELDRLVVSQYTMTQAVVDAIRLAHPLPLAPRRLAELCLPLQPHVANFRVAAQDDQAFVFVSDAHDLRFLDAQVLSPERVQLHPVMGQPGAVVALTVGFSSNLLNAVHYNGRLVLNNGHHRAHALRAMGFTHVPCLVQPCANFEDVQQAACEEICRHADLYFEAPRPPLLRDFDNPLLTHRLAAPRLRREVTLRISVDSRLLAL